MFDEVTRARAGLQAAAQGQDVEKKAAADAAMQQALVRVNAVAEAYPDLKANQNFLSLQEELSGTESKIAYARQFFNDQVMGLNTKIQSFPSSVVRSIIDIARSMA